MKHSITKLLLVIFCLLLSSVFGQQTINHKADTSKTIYLRSTASLPRFAPVYIIDDKEINEKKADSVKTIHICCGVRQPGMAPLYIIDGREIPDSLAKSNHVFKNISPNDILAISILKDAEANALYGVRAAHGVVIVRTKKYSIVQYQKKLSAFSEDYKNYIKKYNDNLIRYLILNPQGSITSFTGDELIRNLYNIPLKAIESVSLMIKETCCGTNRFVVITTKQ